MSVPRSPVSTALESFFTTRTGFPCAYGVLPVDSDGSAIPPPILVLEPLASVFDGPAFGDRTSEGWWSYGLKCVGARLDQAEGLWDRAHAALTAKTNGQYTWPITVPGQYVWAREVDASGFQVGSSRDGIVTLILRFRINTSVG
jgi:hypothetical protein